MNAPFILAWELTRACNLKCLHCRASATPETLPGELTTAEGYDLLDELHGNGTQMVILSGGEPLVRKDVFDIARHGSSIGLRMTMATNGSLITDKYAREIKASGIVRVSVSLDGVTPGVHDEFRGMPGAFDMALEGIRILVKHEVPVQINTTVAAMNISHMHRFPTFIREIGALAWHVFFLVPTGRGENLEPARIQEYKDMLGSFYQVYKNSEIECKATCAPQFYRLVAEKKEQTKTRGCLAGTQFGFISSTGIVQPCGFLQIPCGNIRDEVFSQIWNRSETLTLLRDIEALKSKCGKCTYNDTCGGCRARAYETTGDVMGADPICWYR